MGLVIDGKNITMTQEIISNGHRAGNVYYLRGTQDGREIRYQLYAMGDKYIQLREIWEEGCVVQVDFSYLIRQV